MFHLIAIFLVSIWERKSHIICMPCVLCITIYTQLPSVFFSLVIFEKFRFLSMDNIEEIQGKNGFIFANQFQCCVWHLINILNYQSVTHDNWNEIGIGTEFVNWFLEIKIEFHIFWQSIWANVCWIGWSFFNSSDFIRIEYIVFMFWYIESMICVA